MSNSGCQLQDLEKMSEGEIEQKATSLSGSIVMYFKRRLGPATKRKIKSRINSVLNGLESRPDPSLELQDTAGPLGLEAGELVRVRSLEEIKATLDHFGALRGCGFMPEMVPFCGQTLRVFKPVVKFLDERDYRMKKTSGLVLLEGSICEGTEIYGRCDRACFFFWREEWLERVFDASDEV